MFFVFLLFILFSGSLFCYYLCIFKKVIAYKSKKLNASNKPVSVVICAKDEAGNLKTFLPSIYAQDYPDFEVVLIDDRSKDDTFDVIQSFKEKHPGNTKVVRVNISEDNRLRANKKYALTLGIKAATHNHLLFTDADCRPASPQWIQRMTAKFTERKQLVLGYGAYESKRSFLNKLIRFETVQTALQYFSYALKGMPYMGVGRNLAYTKDLFMDNNGFYTHLDILSGDDDLFVNEAATAENTAVCLAPEAFTVSKPKLTWKAYINQKRRHISTANHYKTKHQLLLSFYFLSLAGFWITALILLIKAYYWPVVLGIVFVRIGMAWYLNYKINNKLHEKSLNLYYPVLEISLLLFQLYIFVLNLIKKPPHWTS